MRLPRSHPPRVHRRRPCWLRWVVLLCALIGALTGAVEAQSTANTHPSTFNGRVEDTLGNPVGPVEVQLFGEDGTLLGTTMTDGSGYFSLPTGYDTGPFEVDVSLGQQTLRVRVPVAAWTGVVVRVPAALAPSSRSGDDAVSLNDLEVPAKARSKLAAALKAEAKPDPARAFKLLDEALALAPNWSRALYVRGALYMDRGEFDEARADLQAAVKADAHDAPAWLELGRLEIAFNHPDLAQQDLKQAVNLPPVLWQAHLALAELDLARGQCAEALLMAQAAATDQPAGPPESHLLAARAADQLHRTDTAIVEYRAYLARAADPNAAAAVDARHRLDALQNHSGS